MYATGPQNPHRRTSTLTSSGFSNHSACVHSRKPEPTIRNATIAILTTTIGVSRRRGCGCGVGIGLMAAIAGPRWRAVKNDTERLGMLTSARGRNYRAARLAGDVLVAHLDRRALPFQPVRQLQRQGGRAMAPAGASKADRQVALALAPVQRDEKAEQTGKFVDEAASLRMAHHVFAHPRVGPVQRLELGDEE